MNLKESLGDLMLRSEAAGTAGTTLVSTLLQFARDANYFSAEILIGPDDPPPATPAADLTVATASATALETALITPVLVAPAS